MKSTHLIIDACSLCQLQCVQCPATKMGYENTIGKGYLTFENFAKIIEDNPQIRSVEFDNFGELFLNKDLFVIMEYAYKRNIMLSCGAGVNLNHVSSGVLAGLIAFRFQYLNVSIDGITQETYEKYRVGGDLGAVIKNIKLINQYKKIRGSMYPKLQWQFIVFGHNEHELPVARKLAESLNMRFYPKMNWNSQYSPIKDIEFVKKETGWDVTTREEYEQKYGESYVRATCLSLWNSPRLSWDLSLTGCCWNVWSRFNEHLEFAKWILCGFPSTSRNIPCLNCEIYRDMVKKNQYFYDWEIRYSHMKFVASNFIKYILWRLNI